MLKKGYKMRCPHCYLYMEKIVNSPYLFNEMYFYKCNHCNYISDLYSDNNKPFGENYTEPADKEKLLDWSPAKKDRALAVLKSEHKTITTKMQKDFGKITDDDYNNLMIDLYHFNKKAEKKKTSEKIVKKKKGKKDDK